MKNYTLFLDESGDQSLRNINKDFPIFILMGLLITNENYHKLCQEITALKIKYFNSTHVILHSRDIRKCDGPFAVLFDLEKKKSFYEDLNTILATHDYMLIASAILKHKHIERYGKLADDPYEISLTFVLERALFENTQGNGINVVIEARGNREDQALARRYNEILYRGSSKVQSKRFLKKFHTELAFKKKRENDIRLQIADLCVYPIARHVLYPQEPYPSFEVIKSKIRMGPKGFEGYGLKIFP